MEPPPRIRQIHLGKESREGSLVPRPHAQLLSLAVRKATKAGREAWERGYRRVCVGEESVKVFNVLNNSKNMNMMRERTFSKG